MAFLLSCLCTFVSMIIVFVILYSRRRSKPEPPWNWPVMGLTPWLLLHMGKLNRSLAELLEATGGTILSKSRYLLGHDILFTSDPVNVNYIMSGNMSIYEKGSEWRKRFDVFGESLFNFDGEEWSHHRRLVRGLFSHQEFGGKVFEIARECVAEGLVPFLERASEHDVTIDLQDVFKRVLFDFASVMATGYRCNSLGDSVVEPPFLNAIDQAGEGIMARYFLPEIVWRIQSWLNLGKEKSLGDAKQTLDTLFQTYFLRKQKDLDVKLASRLKFNLLEIYMTGNEVMGAKDATTYELMKGQTISLLFGIEDNTSATLSWFFLLLSRNANAEREIRDEISRNLNYDGSILEAKDLNKFVYLHAALCETLRLFPPVPLEPRTPVRADTLPSGHRVDRKTMVLVCGYAMGRMSRVWGNDCQEFKPERWITTDGRIKHEPPHKFVAFLSGPRICPGKDIAFTVMKTIAVTMLHKFKVCVSKEHRVKGKLSMVMHVKPGLMAKMERRSNEDERLD